MREFLNSIDDDVRLRGDVAVHWRLKGLGFGELYFYVSQEDGKLYCDNECMSKETIKKILGVMVDQCTLTSDLAIE